MAQVDTAIIVTPILYRESPNIKNEPGIPNLNKLLENGYRIKIVNNFEYEGAVYAHYVLERTNE